MSIDKFRSCLKSLLILTPAALILISLLAVDSMAVSPPSSGSEIPAHVAERQAEMAKSYGESGIARRLRQIKHQSDFGAKNGVAKSATMTNWAIPVIMGSYSDNAHIFNSTDFQTNLFGANPTGSMIDYYDEVSYGAFNLTGTVYGPFTAANTQAYYAVNNGMDGWGSYPQNAAGFIISVLGSADASIDFAQYDNDGIDGVPNSGDDDGYVDALTMIFPDGDASGGDADNIWAHKYSLSSGSGLSPAFTTNDAKNGGGFISINIYTIQGAEKGNGTVNQIKPIGVYCHEFGHVLGLPDLYDTDNSSNGVGTWCLMGSGSWGAAWSSTTENRPIHMNAWSKTYLGWVTPTVVTGTQAFEIPPIETNATVYKIWDDAYQGGRYFLLENRTQTGFHTGLPGEGVLIWHCNDEVFHSNTDDSYRLVDLEEADGLAEIDNKTDHMDAGDLYPGTSNNTSFIDGSNPAATDVFGSVTGLSVTGFTPGAGKNIAVIATQRQLDGYTVDIPGPTWLSGWGLASSVISYGAHKFTAGNAGQLVAVQAGLHNNTPVGYAVRIFNDMVAGSPSGLQSTTNGTFPNVPTDRYYEITLSTPMPISNGQTFLVDVGWGPDNYAVPFTTKTPISGDSYFSTDGSSYSTWTDKDVAIRARIQFAPLSIGDEQTPLPNDYVLEQNFPNPFNPETVIKYSLPVRSHVEITVFNLLGQQVRHLVNGFKPAGQHTVKWTGRDESNNEVATGIYFYRLQADEQTMFRKMILLK